MAEGARLESVYTAMYRGFESPSLRRYLNFKEIDRNKKDMKKQRKIFFDKKRQTIIPRQKTLKSNAYKFLKTRF